MPAHKRRKAGKKPAKKRKVAATNDTTRTVPIAKKKGKKGGKREPARKRKKAAKPAQPKSGSKKKKHAAKSRVPSKQSDKSKPKAPRKKVADKPKPAKGGKKKAKKAGKVRAASKRKKARIVGARKRSEQPVVGAPVIEKVRRKLRRKGIEITMKYGPADSELPGVHPAGSAVSGQPPKAVIVAAPPNIELPVKRWEGTGRQPTIVLPPVLDNKIRSKVYLVKMGRSADFSEDDKPGEDIVRFTTSTSGMHSSNDNYFKLFTAAFGSFVGRTQFEDLDDIPFFRFGMSIRTKYKMTEKKIQALIPQLADLLQAIVPKGGTAHIVDEGQFLSVRMNLGNYRNPTLFSEAKEYIRKNKKIFEALRLGAADLLDDDFVWFLFWDTEDLYY